MDDTFRYYPSASTGVFGKRLRSDKLRHSDPESTTRSIPYPINTSLVDARGGMNVITNLPSGPVSQSDDGFEIIYGAGGLERSAAETKDEEKRP